MYKLIKKGNTVIVILGNGQSIKNKNLSKQDYKLLQKALEADDTNAIFEIMVPKFKETLKQKSEVEKLLNFVDNSSILVKRGNSVYWDEISPLSIPEDFAKKIVEAENTSNELLLNTYKNFWILLSLNPDEECRKNLFWFLQYHGMVLSKSGFFIAYRNVVNTNKFTSDNRPIYTDQYSHTTRIIIGEPVKLDIEKCDRDSNCECSKGLHVASVKWLERNYFGDTGLVVLVNPAKVVAVPHDSGYGKLRTCEYLPIDYAQYDETETTYTDMNGYVHTSREYGKLIPYDVSDGFECKYVSQVIYEGLLNKENSAYTIDIPEIPGINKTKITDNLLSIARECIQNKK